MHTMFTSELEDQAARQKKEAEAVKRFGQKVMVIQKPGAEGVAAAGAGADAGAT